MEENDKKGGTRRLGEENAGHKRAGTRRLGEENAGHKTAGTRRKQNKTKTRR